MGSAATHPESQLANRSALRTVHHHYIFHWIAGAGAGRGGGHARYRSLSSLRRGRHSHASSCAWKSLHRNKLPRNLRSCYKSHTPINCNQALRRPTLRVHALLLRPGWRWRCGGEDALGSATALSRSPAACTWVLWSSPTRRSRSRRSTPSSPISVRGRLSLSLACLAISLRLRDGGGLGSGPR